MAGAEDVDQAVAVPVHRQRHRVASRSGDRLPAVAVVVDLVAHPHQRQVGRRRQPAVGRARRRLQPPVAAGSGVVYQPGNPALRLVVEPLVELHRIGAVLHRVSPLASADVAPGDQGVGIDQSAEVQLDLYRSGGAGAAVERNLQGNLVTMLAHQITPIRRAEDPPQVDPIARTTASGSRSITVSRTRAARSGTRRPCSQSWTARASRPKRSANFCRLSFIRLRSATIRSAVGSSMIPPGSSTSPRTWARTSPSADSTSRPI